MLIWVNTCEAGTSDFSPGGLACLINEVMLYLYRAFTGCLREA